AVLLVVVAAVLLLLRRPEAEAPEEDAPAASTERRSPAPTTPGRPAGPSSPAPEAPAAERPAALAPFTGRIVSSEDGQPVVGAEVTFLAPEGATSVRSGPDGRFRLVPPRVGPPRPAPGFAEGFVPSARPGDRAPFASSPRRRPAR